MFNRSCENKMILIIFFVCLYTFQGVYALKGAKKTNQKKRHPWNLFLRTALCLYPLWVLLEAVGILKTRFTQTIQNPHRHFLRCSASANGKKYTFRVSSSPFERGNMRPHALCEELHFIFCKSFREKPKGGRVKRPL